MSPGLLSVHDAGYIGFLRTAHATKARLPIAEGSGPMIGAFAQEYGMILRATPEAV